jgi:hypothetical protein
VIVLLPWNSFELVYLCQGNGKDYRQAKEGAGDWKSRIGTQKTQIASGEVLNLNLKASQKARAKCKFRHPDTS